jgi:hypothetical protein
MSEQAAARMALSDLEGEGHGDAGDPDATLAGGAPDA